MGKAYNKLSPASRHAGWGCRRPYGTPLLSVVCLVVVHLKSAGCMIS